MKILLCPVICLMLFLAACGGNASAPPDDLDLTAVNYGDVAFQVVYGDYPAMGRLMDAVSSGELDGKVVFIDGIYDEITGPCIMEDNGKGMRHGITISVVGYRQRDYPAVDTHVQITGVVVPEAFGVYNVYTLPEHFVII
ncbi:MAG: hypothetical protein IKD96_02110 [Oscillospiraceae bacterium]|nr:hypothetical protein [Oscillospiraceae bacterium]